MSLPLRKRLDYRLLRWQARFESTGFNRTAPWAIATVLWVLLLLLGLARSRELSEETSLAGAMQTVWLIGNGFVPKSTLLAHNYLFEQAGYLIYPVALLAKIFPTAITLLVVQSGALAVGVVPLWRIARNIVKLRIGSTVAIAIAYGAYSAIHAVNLAGFHLEALALPALLAAVYNGMRGTWVRYWLFVAIVLSARADLGLAIAGLGILWWVDGRRRVGYATFAVGFGWAAAAILLIQPAYAGGDYPHVEAFAAYGGDDPFRVLWGMLSNPIEVLQELFSEANFGTIVTLLAPVLFLPVGAPRYLMPAVPLYSLYLVADVPEGTLAEAGQIVPITAFVFVALVFGLAKTGRVVVERVNVDRRVVGALLFTAMVFFAADAVTSPYQKPWSWGSRDAVDEARLEVRDMIPADGVVRAAPKVLPLITQRVGLFELDLPDDRSTQAADLADNASEGVNWIVFDQSEVPSWAGTTGIGAFCQTLAFAGWVPVARENGVFAYTFADQAERLGLEIAYRDENQTAIC